MASTFGGRRQQPPLAGSYFDFSHPLARECSLWVSPLVGEVGSRYLIDHSIGRDAFLGAIPSTAFVGLSDGGGAAIKYPNISANFIDVPRSAQRLRWGNNRAFTMLVFWRRFGGGNTSHLFKSSGAFGNTCLLGHRVTAQGDDMIFRWGANVGGPALDGPVAGPRQSSYHAVAVHGADNAIKIYQDGVVVNSGPDAATWDLTTVGAQLGQNNGGNNTNGDVFIYACWNRALSDYEVAWLNAEPWALLRQRSPQILYSIGEHFEEFSFSVAAEPIVNIDLPPLPGLFDVVAEPTAMFELSAGDRIFLAKASPTATFEGRQIWHTGEFEIAAEPTATFEDSTVNQGTFSVQAHPTAQVFIRAGQLVQCIVGPETSPLAAPPNYVF